MNRVQLVERCFAEESELNFIDIQNSPSQPDDHATNYANVNCA